jgi:hypothetical protein
MSNSFLTKNQNYKLLSFCIFGFLILFMNSLYAHGIGGKDALYLQQNSGQAMPIFIYLGAKHMITGYDHLLYLCGVIFFLFRLKEVAIFVSLFALGHSITLLAGVLSGLQVNPFIVDAIIGLSVVYKALENLDSLKSVIAVPPNPKIAVFSFGLVHGLGLATKLQEISLSSDGLILNIISFNIGVEIGQLIALLGALIMIKVWRDQGGFYRHSRIFNLILMLLGFLLALHQMLGYFFI